VVTRTSLATFYAEEYQIDVEHRLTEEEAAAAPFTGILSIESIR
jgi:hypothetical protein